jgi:hypothetical protein
VEIRGFWSEESGAGAEVWEVVDKINGNIRF